MNVSDNAPNVVVNISEKLPTQNVHINLPLTSKNSKGFTDEAFDPLFEGEYDSEGFGEIDKNSSKSLQSSAQKKRKERLEEDYQDEDDEEDFLEKKLKKPRTSDDEEDDLGSYSEERELGLGDEDFDEVRPNRTRRTKSQPIPADDRVISEFIEKMEQAYKEDKAANLNKQPALAKLKLLPEVLSLFHKQSIRESYFDGGFLKQCKNWLSPLPDGTLPNMKIREGILKSLEKLDLTEDLLRASGIGRAVMTLSKHKSESLPNQKICTALISKWSRPIFDISSTYKELEKYEKETHLQINNSKKPKRKLSLSQDPLDLSSSQEVLPSYTIRPQKVRMEYSIRPPSWGGDMKKEKGSQPHSKPNKIQERISALRASKRAKVRAVSVGVNKPTRYA